MSNEHTAIGVAVGSAIATQLAEVMPQIQADLVQGRPVSGITVRVALRPGMGGTGEGPVVADLEFSVINGPAQAINIAPSPHTGEFTPMNPNYTPPVTVNTPAVPVNAPQYPSAQTRPAPGPLVPRTVPLPPPASFEQPGPQMGLTGAIPAEVPVQQPGHTMSPEEYAAWYAQQPGVVSAPAPTGPAPLVRLARPAMPGDGGIERVQ